MAAFSSASKLNLPTLARFLARFVLRGAMCAVLAPLFILVFWAVYDFEALRHFLAEATSGEMRKVVLMVVGLGVCVGGVMPAGVGLPSQSRLARIKELEQNRWGPVEAWYWAQQPDGRELAIREATTARCSPNAEIRWALDDLIKELERTDAKLGSDLLDYKVTKLLGLQSLMLKPTQNVADARRLLGLRYRGVQSRFEWEVRSEAVESRYRVYVAVRPAVRATGVGAEPWRRCSVAEGATEALAVTIAAITRETWTYTT